LIGVDEPLSLLPRAKKADLSKGFLKRCVKLFDLLFLLEQRTGLNENNLVCGA